MCNSNNISLEPSNLTLEQLSAYFHLPINEAAMQLGVCPTVLKKMCRSKGVDRWPHRKIKSIDSLIESLQKVIDENGEAPKLNMDMNVLLEKKRYLLENPNVSYKSVVSKYCINSFRAQIQKAKQGTPEISEEKFEVKPKISTPIKKKPVVAKKNVFVPAPVVEKKIEISENEAANILSNMTNESTIDFELQQYINNAIRYARVSIGSPKIPEFQRLISPPSLRMSG